MFRLTLSCLVVFAIFVSFIAPVDASSFDTRNDLRAMRFRALMARGSDSSIRDLLSEEGNDTSIRDLLTKKAPSIRDLLAKNGDAQIRDLLIKVTTAQGSIRDLLCQGPKQSQTTGDDGLRDLLSEEKLSIRELLDEADLDGLRDLLLSTTGNVRELLASHDDGAIRDLLAAVMQHKGIRDLLLGDAVASESQLITCVKASQTASDNSIRDLLAVDPQVYKESIRDLLSRNSDNSIRDLLARASTGGIRDLLANESDIGIRDLLGDLSVASTETLNELTAGLR